MGSVSTTRGSKVSCGHLGGFDTPTLTSALNHLRYFDTAFGLLDLVLGFDTSACGRHSTCFAFRYADAGFDTQTYGLHSTSGREGLGWLHTH